MVIWCQCLGAILAEHPVFLLGEERYVKPAIRDRFQWSFTKNWATHGIFTNSTRGFRISAEATMHLFMPFGGDPAILNGWKWFHHHHLMTFLEGIRASMRSFPKKPQCTNKWLQILQLAESPQKSISSVALRCGVFFPPTSNLKCLFLITRVFLKHNFNCSGMDY